MRFFISVILLMLSSQNSLADTFLFGNDSRDNFIVEGKVWQEPRYNISDESLTGTTPQCSEFSPDEVVTCSYLYPKRGKPGSGWTPKFYCKTADGEKLKVKYGQNNGEVFSEVFSSRLVQLLGFKADCNYPVKKVVCLDCPENPFQYSQDFARSQEDPNARFAVREFPYALIEKKFGKEIISNIDGKEIEGWGFDEFLRENLRHEDQEQNLAREALTLLMSVLEHGDNKRSNQRLYCKTPLSADGVCPNDQKYLVVQDLGATLGTYKFKDKNGQLVNMPPTASFEYFKYAPIWSIGRNARWSQCTVQVIAFDSSKETATLKSQAISEDGRLFLVDLLSQVSKEQIAELVKVSKLAERTADQDVAEKMTKLIRDESKLSRLPVLPFNEDQVSADNWIDLIWQRLKSVENSSCPSITKRNEF